MSRVPFNRADWLSARRTLEKLFPDDAARRRVLQIVARDIETACHIDAAMWGTTLDPRALRLNIGRGAAVSLSSNRLVVVLDSREIDLKTRRILEFEAQFEAPGRFKTAPHAAAVSFSGAQIEQLWPLITAAHANFVEEAARGFESRAPRSPTWRDAHSPGFLAYLSRELGRAIASPSYAAASQPEPAPEATFDAEKLLCDAVAARGLSFPASHLAAFFTALSSKGLVILSGPSGVGKTALTLAFADLLPQPGQSETNAQCLQAAQSQSGKIRLTGAALGYFGALRSGETRAVTVVCEDAAHGAKIVGEIGGAHLQLRGAARKWLAAHEGKLLSMEPEWDSDAQPTFHLLLHAKNGVAPQSNHLFLPVRPDWRDEKPLLGYFNPLANRYEWTPFLRFLLRAQAGFRAGDGLAYFVVFDEMNLARLEWYFADLLSILEAPRDESGISTEPLRFDFDARATGEVPPRELFLPPNLYFIGTINADETAQPLAPKVLDRSWVLDAPNVDFSSYPPRRTEFSASGAHRKQLLELFTRGARFASPDKALVAAQLEKHPARRDDLSQLNGALESSGAAFGFRVFDEILTFCAVGEQNGLFEGENAAFDAAVALKIAPRLRGLRGQVEAALNSLLRWSEARHLAQTTRATRKLLTQLERDGFLP